MARRTADLIKTGRLGRVPYLLLVGAGLVGLLASHGLIRETYPGLGLALLAVIGVGVIAATHLRLKDAGFADPQARMVPFSTVLIAGTGATFVFESRVLMYATVAIALLLLAYVGLLPTKPDGGNQTRRT